MQDWMIALIVIAAVVAVAALIVLVGALVAVRLLLGRRKPLSQEETAAYKARYGVDTDWFDKYKDVTEKRGIVGYDGVKLSARLIKHATPYGRVAICCHGYGLTSDYVQPQAKLFYDRGFDVLVPALRGHEGSGGKVGMAWVDRFDVARWIEKTIEEYGSDVQIALFGASMGGSTVVSVAGMTPPPQVKCVIDDCGFSSQLEEYSSQFSAPLVFFIKLGVRLVHGYSVSDADFTALARNMRVPALFIHGSSDRFVPCALGKKLFEACASQDKKFVCVDNAAHCCSYVVDTATYVGELTAFVDKHVEGSERVIEDPPAPPAEAETATEPVATTTDKPADGE